MIFFAKLSTVKNYICTQPDIVDVRESIFFIIFHFYKTHWLRRRATFSGLENSHLGHISNINGNVCYLLSGLTHTCYTMHCLWAGPIFKIALHTYMGVWYEQNKIIVTTSFKLPFHCNDIILVVKNKSTRPENLKKSRQKTREIKYIKFFFVKSHFWQF